MHDNRDLLLPSPLLIVEDEPTVRMRLWSILETLGYTQEHLLFAGSISEATALFVEQPIAMALIDIGLPDGSGVDLIRHLHTTDAALPLLVISTLSTEHVIVGALQAGATGYLLKERTDIEIALSIRSVMRGGAPIDPFVAKHILELAGVAALKLASAEPPATQTVSSGRLSRREIEILGHVSTGLTNLEISELLNLSKLTVECHIRNIYKKLAVGSRTAAVFEARANGLLP
jgi:DNA-binding NarL/FixJ family response regulator